MIYQAFALVPWWGWLVGMGAGVCLAVWAISEVEARRDADAAEAWAWMQEAAR